MNIWSGHSPGQHSIAKPFGYVFISIVSMQSLVRVRNSSYTYGIEMGIDMGIETGVKIGVMRVVMTHYEANELNDFPISLFGLAV